jgi:hypothetical protein
MYATTSFDRPTDNPALEAAEARAAIAESVRRQLDVDDVLAELCASICDQKGRAHPLYALVAHCITVGTEAETYKRPSMSACVGDALQPYILRAIERLVSRAMGED